MNDLNKEDKSKIGFIQITSSVLPFIKVDRSKKVHKN